MHEVGPAERHLDVDGFEAVHIDCHPDGDLVLFDADSGSIGCHRRIVVGLRFEKVCQPVMSLAHDLV